jgi:hypothetical protein
MRALLLTLLLTLMACGPTSDPLPEPDPGPDAGPEAPDAGPVEAPDAGPTSACTVPCLKAVYPEADAPVDCPVIVRNMAMIVALYEEAGITTSSQACQLLSEVNLYVRPEQDGWEYAPGRTAGGLYWGWNMTMVQNMVGLAHETLHAYEHLLGIIDWSNPHGGWDTKPGYSYFLTAGARRACAQFSSCG